MSLGVAAIGTRPRSQKRLSRNDCLRSATLMPVRTPTPGESSHDRRRRDCVVCIMVCLFGVESCSRLDADNGPEDLLMKPHSKHPTRAVSCAIILANSGHASL